MKKVVPTIHFNGRCEEAVRFYEVAFGARVGCLLHYSDRDINDWNEPLTPEQEKFVYHAEIFIGEQRIMMSDTIEPEANASTFLTVSFDSADDVKKAYEILKDGCTVVVPMHSTTYSACMVSLVDKFGIRWGLMKEGLE